MSLYDDFVASSERTKLFYMEAFLLQVYEKLLETMEA